MSISCYVTGVCLAGLVAVSLWDKNTVIPLYFNVIKKGFPFLLAFKHQLFVCEYRWLNENVTQQWSLSLLPLAQSEERFPPLRDIWNWSFDVWYLLFSDGFRHLLPPDIRQTRLLLWNKSCIVSVIVFFGMGQLLVCFCCFALWQ